MIATPLKKNCCSSCRPHTTPPVSLAQRYQVSRLVCLARGRGGSLRNSSRLPTHSHTHTPTRNTSSRYLDLQLARKLALPVSDASSLCHKSPRPGEVYSRKTGVPAFSRAPDLTASRFLVLALRCSNAFAARLPFHRTTPPTRRTDRTSNPSTLCHYRAVKLLSTVQ